MAHVSEHTADFNGEATAEAAVATAAETTGAGKLSVVR